MIDPPNQLPHNLPEILKFRLSLQMVKDDWPPLLDCPEFTRNFKVKKLGCTYSKMIDPPTPYQLPSGVYQKF